MNTSDSSRSNKAPLEPLIEYQPPHSAFQKLIDSQRKRCGLTARELAEKIGVSQTTLYIWLHNLYGFPRPKSFNTQYVRRLGQVLNIPKAEIQAALDVSRQAAVRQVINSFGRIT